ncbi:hypothetical protein ACGFR6_34970 [Streptomyces sp. NPDC048567]|uniref:hypothetical protein n=1 Tax=Streptomyces TaxID=1883 RepID=UPI0015E17110|nr:hypothetical protein [Streptomyces sp. SM13]
MSDTHVVLYDPEGRFDAELALDRALHKALVKAVLGWTVDPAVTTQTRVRLQKIVRWWIMVS